ncbi:MAG TPA: GNAT family N-acetyltransferase [Mycobacteriales bacterium]
MTVVPIGPADPERAGTVSRVIAEAFAELAVVGWLVPDAAARDCVLSADFRIFVDHAFEYGEVHATPDLDAVALWFPLDGDPLPEPNDYHRRLTDAVGEWIDRFSLLDKLFEANHPTEPHHHLAFLAVRPDRQGNGLGSALLRHHHARLDHDGMPAYLEASSPGSRDLYLRHGYQLRGEPFTVPGGTPFWPMWRPPSPG